MQGGKEGTRPYTAVLTKAEMKKFDRSVLGFLVNIPASRNRQPGQCIDYDAFAESWNADVKLEEEQANKGLVLVHGHNLVNRKRPVDLRFHMNVSKKATNSKRTMNPYKAELSALNKSLRVSLLSETSAGGAPIGALPSGDRVVFPIPADATTARPRPRPVVPLPFTPPGGGVGGGLSPSAQAVDRPGVDPGVGVVQRSLPVSAAGAVGAARGGGTASSPPVSVAGSAVSLEGGARGRSATTSPMNATELAGRIGMPTGVGGADGTSPIGLSAGTPCFVMPIPACGTLRNIAPTFEVGSALPQPWNPHLPLAATIAQPASKRRAKPCCQECGHLYTTGVYKSPEYHIRTGKKLTCLVKERFPDKVRRPDFEYRAKGRYKTCTCESCAASSG